MPLTASAAAVAGLVDGRTRLTEIRSQVPLSLRETADGLTILASAFSPLGGDRTRLQIDVRPGAELAVGSAAAQVAQPGPHSAVSTASIALRVGGGGQLRWHPKPLVVAAGAEHRLDLDVELSAGARAVVVDTVVLGLTARPPGRYRSRWRVCYAGRPLLHTDLDVGAGAPAGWAGPAVTYGARVLITALLVGFPPLPADLRVAGGELLELAGPGLLLSWLGPDTVAAAAAVAAVLALLPASGSPAGRSAIAVG